MSISNQVKDVKGKKLNWTNVNNSFIIKETWQPETPFYGFYIWPRTGDSHAYGEELIFDNVGQEIIDSTNVQGARVVKDLCIRAVGASNIKQHTFFIAVCKYNKSYGGTPFPSGVPVPNSVNFAAQWCDATPLIKYYQSCIGAAVFYEDKCDEMIIKCPDVILDSDDSIMVCIGNIDLLGEITSGESYAKENYISEHDTYVSCAGTVSCAIAYL